MVQIGSVAGALLTFLIADRVDRLWPTRHLCALWILGIVIFLANGGRLGQVYAGRFIAGIGIGETSKSFAQHVCLYVVFSFLHVRTSRLTRPPFSFAQLSSHLFTSQKSHPSRFAACAPAFSLARSTSESCWLIYPPGALLFTSTKPQRAHGSSPRPCISCSQGSF